jgi:hypothetical protein
MAGRPTGVVRKFLCDAGDDHMCSMAGCGKKRKKTPYQASKWAEHLCLKCLHAPEAVKREVAKHHQTLFIKLKYDSNGHPIGESTRQPQTGPTTAGGTPAVSPIPLSERGMGEKRVVVGYWNTRALVQPIRVMLAYMEVPFEDRRIQVF